MLTASKLSACREAGHLWITKLYSQRKGNGLASLLKGGFFVALHFEGLRFKFKFIFERLITIFCQFVLPLSFFYWVALSCSYYSSFFRPVQCVVLLCCFYLQSNSFVQPICVMLLSLIVQFFRPVQCVMLLNTFVQSNALFSPCITLLSLTVQFFLTILTTFIGIFEEESQSKHHNQES